jgi:hypothetical protein
MNFSVEELAVLALIIDEEQHPRKKEKIRSPGFGEKRSRGRICNSV